MTSPTTVDRRALVDEARARAGCADSTPSAQATAPPRRSDLGALGGQVLLGLEVGRPAQVEPGVGERARASLTSVLGATESCEK